MNEHTEKKNSPPPKLPKYLEQYDLNGDGHLSEAEIGQIHLLPEATRAPIEEETAFLVVLELLGGARLARNKLVPTKGITFDEFSVLALLRADLERNKANPAYAGLSQSFIATETNLLPSTISSLLDKLATRMVPPWITRAENPANRREKLIGITPDGRANLRIARQDFKAQIRASLLSAFNLSELLAMREILYRFNVSINPGHEPSGGEPQGADASD